MDIYCIRCSEPVDNDELHHVAQDEGRTYAQVSADFRAIGCSVLGYSCQPREDQPRDRVFGLTPAEASSALYDLLGDDMDGAASMMEDMFG